MEAERSLCLSETTHPHKEEVLLSQYNAKMRLNFLVFRTNLNARVHVTSVCDQAAYECSPLEKMTPPCIIIIIITTIREISPLGTFPAPIGA